MSFLLVSWNFSIKQAEIDLDLKDRILEWVAFPFSRGSSQHRDQTQVSCIAGRFFTIWATREAQEYWSRWPNPSPADLSNPAIEPGSPVLKVDSLPPELPGKHLYLILHISWIFHWPLPLDLEFIHTYKKKQKYCCCIELSFRSFLPSISNIKEIKYMICAFTGDETCLYKSKEFWKYLFTND